MGSDDRRRATMRAAALLASLAVAAGCSRAAAGAAPPVDALAEAGDAYADVLRFVRQEHPSADVRWLVRLPGSGALLFAAYDKAANGGGISTRPGFRLRERVGWLPRHEGEEDPRVFRFRPGDGIHFTPEFARALHAATGGEGAWTYPFGPTMAADSATPRRTLVFLLETDVRLHRALLANPRVRASLPMLMAISRAGGVQPYEWAPAARPALGRATRERGATRETLAAALETLDESPASVETAMRVVDHPRARGDTALLLAAARVHGDAHAPLRARATDGLLHLRSPPRALWRALPWWERQPRRIDDAAVRRDMAALKWVAGAVDPWRFPGVMAGAHRHLLAHPGTDAETVQRIAWEISGNLRRCRPYPHPARELALAALAHPSARGSDVAGALLHVPGMPEVRDAAYRRLTGRPPPPGGLPLAHAYTEDGLLRMAHRMASHEVLRRDWRPVVDSALARLGDGAEAAEWRRIVADVRDDEKLADLLVAGDARMTRLRRRSPFLSLLAPAERNDLGVACDAP